MKLMTEDEAQVIGLKGLEFLAADQEKIAGFLSLTGMSPDDLINIASEKTTLIGILDYLLSDESILMDFCENATLTPDAPKLARITLSGEDYY